jgi:hypothetical protein
VGRPGREFGHIGQTSQTLYLSELDYEEVFLFPNHGQTIFLKIRLRSTKTFPHSWLIPYQTLFVKPLYSVL